MNITYCEYSEKDFDEYCRCLNGFYHGHHPYPEYFRKEFLQGLIGKGELIIALAKTDEGRVVGTSSAQRMAGTFENSVLLGMRYIEPDFRGMGIAKKQESFLMDLVQRRFAGAESIYADVVTNNDFSQRTLLDHGFCFCGINLMYYREPMYQSKYPEEDFKLSMAVYAKAVKKTLRTVYPPEEYGENVKKIYDCLGVPCRLLQEDGKGETSYIRKDMASHGTTEFYVSRIGADTEGFLGDVEDAIQGGNVISVYLNIATPGAQALCRRMKETGFCYCGMKPLNDGPEYLIMCQTANHPGDLRNIQIPPENKPQYRNILGGSR